MKLHAQLGNATSGEPTSARLRIPSVAVEYRLRAMNRDIRLTDIAIRLRSPCRRNVPESDDLHVFCLTTISPEGEEKSRPIFFNPFDT